GFAGEGFHAGPEGHRGPRGRGSGGEVTAIGDSTLTIQNRKGESVTVNVTDDTRIFLVESQSEGSLSDISVGDKVGIRGQRNDDGTVNARGIMVAPRGDHAGGRVTAIDGQTITVENRDGEAKIVTNDSTEFRIGRDQTGSIADVTTDKRVMAFGETQDDGSLAARLVFVGERGPKGPREGLRGGEVTSIDGTSFTIQTRNGTEVTVQTNADTQYRTRGDAEVTFADIQVGGRVMVKGQPVEGAENTVLAEVVGIKTEQSSQ
ncbi:MAG: DUF5666 domain-containing protein, partial [Anaerolineae bacterium]|nr:DUF5666 domain-containing protein [Anaerolineae bacterium]